MATDVADRIQSEITENPVMLYMKGNAMFPQCGFSARVVQILSHLNVPFKTANVLEDDSLREGVKEFSSWPTVPQLYVKGEFVGGCDNRDRDVPVGRAREPARGEGHPAPGCGLNVARGGRGQCRRSTRN